MTLENKTLYIIIGCDTDPDRPGFVRGAEECKSWRGLEEGIPQYKELAAKLTDSLGNTPKITWLLRADEQVNIINDDYAWVIRKYEKILKTLESSGDELGWHPHFFRINAGSGNWHQEVSDINWQIRMLDEAYKAYNAAMPGHPISVRMGWDFHNNATMKKLAELGIKVEFSALPGLKTRAAGGAKDIYNIFDWSISPREPYLPSSADYRRSPRSPENSLDILEIPIFTSSSFIWGLISGLQFTRKMKDPLQLFQTMRRPAYVINITGKPKLFSPILSSLEKTIKLSNRSSNFFATYFHADELLDNQSSFYSRFNMLTNLHAIVDICEKSNVKVQFIRAGEAVQLINKS
jgi:hypothetical protein